MASSSGASPQALVPFQDAFCKFEEVVTAEDSRDFHSTTLEDVRKAARNIEEQLGARQCLRNMRRIEPFIDGLTRYSKVVEVLCNGTPFLPWIWAPVKLMLQLASEQISAFEKLIAAYAQIADALPRFQRLSDVFKDTAEFQQVLAVFYTDILGFHKTAYKFFRKRGWTLLFKSSWKGFDARFKVILNSLVKHSKLVDKEANSFDIVEAKEWRTRWFDEISKKEKARVASQFQDVLSWLEVSGSEQEDKIDDLSNRSHSGSCNWILSNQKIKLWMRKGPDQPIMWLKGKPGSGKSVLCSKMIQFLRQDNQNAVLVYFCSYLSSGSYNCVRVLRSLVGQLLRNNQELASLIFDDYIVQGVTASASLLRKIIPHLLSTITSTRIVIDGLDEYSEKDQKQVLLDVLPFASSNITRGICKILISSRDVPPILRALSNKPTLSLAEEDKAIRGAIQSFVHENLLEIQTNLQDVTVEDQLIVGIENKLVLKANGMFLWVQLVLATLENVYSIHELNKAVETLPEELYGVYDRILDGFMARTSADNRETTVRMLQWIACASRPLRKFEIQDGVALHDGTIHLNDNTKLSEQVLNLCKPLIEDGPHGTITFVHFTVREYLLNKPNNPFLKATPAHHNIAFACIVYLTSSFILIDPDCSMEKRLVAVGKGFHGLHQYADEHWTAHLLTYLHLRANSPPPDPSDSLMAQLQILCNVHRRLEQRLRPNGGTNSEHDIGVTPDDRLDCLSFNPGTRSLLQQYLNFRRRSSTRKQDEKASTSQDSKDPTLFGMTLHAYNEIVRQLLDSDSVSGLSEKNLATFKKLYGSFTCYCRVQSCPRAFEGFRSLQDRDKHELTHRPNLACTDINCSYSEIGFKSTRALKRHFDEFHSTSSEPKGRKKVRAIPGEEDLTSREQREKSATPGEQREKSATPGEVKEENLAWETKIQPATWSCLCHSTKFEYMKLYGTMKNTGEKTLPTRFETSRWFLVGSLEPSDMEGPFLRHLASFAPEEWALDIQNGLLAGEIDMLETTFNKTLPEPPTEEEIRAAISQDGIQLDKLVQIFQSRLISRRERLRFFQNCSICVAFNRFTTTVYDPAKCTSPMVELDDRAQGEASNRESEGIFEYLESNKIVRGLPELPLEQRVMLNEEQLGMG